MVRDERVLDHAHADGLEERERAAGEAVQEVQDGVAPVRVRRVAGRQVDDDLLAPAAESGARDEDLAAATPGDVDVGGLARRREAAVEPVVHAVAVDADARRRLRNAANEHARRRGNEAGRPRNACRAIVSIVYAGS